jgi:hypothetical protein
MAQAEEPSKNEALSSNPYIPQKKKKGKNEQEDDTEC